MISRDDWLRALDEAGITTHEVDDQDAATAKEFAEMFGVPLNTAKHKLDALVAQGKARATRKSVLNDYGRRISQRAWRLL